MNSTSLSAGPAREPLAPTRADVVVFSDVDGAAALWARDPATMRDAIAIHDAVVRSLLAVYDVAAPRPAGSGNYVVFRSAATAARFCVALQVALAEAAWPVALLEQPEAAVEPGRGGRPILAGLRVRMGLHVAAEHDGADPAEAAVRRAGRLCGAAHGGQVLATSTTWRAIEGATGGDLSAHDLDEHHLCGVSGAVRLVDIRGSGTAARRFPAPRTREILRSNVNAHRDAFLGRESDLAAILELFRLGVRAISVVGGPGLGRGRLCHEVAASWLATMPAGGGGAWVVNAPDVQDVDELLQEIATTLDAPLAPGRTAQDAVQQLSRVLRGRGETLLVIDGVDPWFREGVAALAAWQRKTPELRLLAVGTSPLGLDREVPYELGALDLPTDGPLATASASRLLVRRVRERGQLVGDGQDLAEVVRRSLGLPLALEILAGQLATRPAGAVREDLDARRSAGDLPLEAVFHATLSRLAAWERGALARWSIFTSTFDAGAAEAVANLSEWAFAPAIEDALEALVARGLIQRGSRSEDPATVGYRLHPALRGHVRRALSPVEADDAARRRARHATEVARRWAAHLGGTHGAEALAALAEHRADLVASFEYDRERATSDRDAAATLLDVALALDPLLARRGPLRSHEERLGHAIRCAAQRDDLARPRVRALVARARIRFVRGAVDDATQDLATALDVARGAGDPEGIGMALALLGQLQATSGHIAEARATLEEALRELDAADAPREQAHGRAALGALLIRAGSLDRAIEHLSAAVRGFRAVNDHQGEALASSRLGEARRRTGKLDAAEHDLNAAREALRRLGDGRREASVLEELAAVRTERGDAVGAAALTAVAKDLAHRTGDVPGAARATLREGIAWLDAERLSDARRAFEEAGELAREGSGGATEGLAAAGLGAVLHTEGDLAGALAHYERGAALCADAGAWREEALVVALGAIARHRLGDVDGARLHGQRLIERADGLDDPTLASLVHLVARGVVEGDPARVAAEAERLRAQSHVPAPVRLVLRIVEKGGAAPTSGPGVERG
jgi:tetratricopeptide (TPR) repeat protein